MGICLKNASVSEGFAKAAISFWNVTLADKKDTAREIEPYSS